jgi:MYXO-CTERM domain-containing protein
MKSTHTAIVAAAALAATAGVANANIPVELTGSENITETGQTFVFDFTNVPAALSDATLTIDALGDYSIVPPSSETLDWDVDGIASGQGFAESAFPDPDNVDLFQNDVKQSFNITLADMQAITADGSVTVTLVNGSSVNFFTDQPEDFVSFSLSYTGVPSPGAAGLLGLAGLAAIRRRR